MARVALACLALLALGAVAALASQRGQTILVGANSTGSALGSCPQGQRSVAVGFDDQLDLPIGSGAVVLPSALRMQPNGVTTQATNDGPASGEMEAFVYCSVRAKARKSRIKKVPLPDGGKASATATCPPKTTVLGGGYQVPIVPNGGTPVDVISALVRPTRRTWRVTAVSLPGSSATAGHVTAIAYCGAGPPAVQASTTKTVDSGATRHLIAHCPAGRHVLFGGARTQLGSAFGSPGVTPFGLVRAGLTKWKLVAANDGAPGKATAIVYCR
jgi:hypothetical protein